MFAKVCRLDSRYARNCLQLSHEGYENRHHDRIYTIHDGCIFPNALSFERNDLQEKLEKAYQRLYQAGAHYVVDGIWDIPKIIDQIQEKLKLGEKP